MLANKLKKGDTIGVVCPSDKVHDEDIPEIKEAERLLKERGYNVVFGNMHLKIQLDMEQQLKKKQKTLMKCTQIKT